ncbi:hypothetical protein [Agrococcus sp. KRD186]|uniref:hypothetical protein n=1 Tax=Agrococcus sp. KRD186 TaxID=2729730 RepID=UPI0019D05441|nr:hypothetical protein [Agrococcus sp. KRD186]
MPHDLTPERLELLDRLAAMPSPTRVLLAALEHREPLTQALLRGSSTGFPTATCRSWPKRSSATCPTRGPMSSGSCSCCRPRT